MNEKPEEPMFEEKLPRRVTIRLTPYQSRRLWKLRTAGLPEGARPRSVTETLVHALLDAARAVEQDEPSVTASEPGNTPMGPTVEAAGAELEVELPAAH
jgi:hypothetical protein